MKKYKKRMKNKIIKTPNKPNKLEQSIQQNHNLVKAKMIFRWLIIILIVAMLFILFTTL